MEAKGHNYNVITYNEWLVNMIALNEYKQVRSMKQD